MQTKTSSNNSFKITVQKVKDWLNVDANKAKLDEFLAIPANKQAITGLSVGAALFTGSWITIVAVTALAYGLYKQDT